MPTFVRSVAVVIGINEYTHIRHLTTAVDDAMQLAVLLREQHEYDNVFTLTEAVTQARLYAFFSTELQDLVGTNDRLLLYFAGHGIALNGEDGPEGYLIPQDARSDDRSTFIAMADLYDWLEALPCRHLLAILDCCFAGAFTWYRRRNLRPVRDTLYQEHYDRFLREPAWQVLTSAAYDQEALDVLAGKPIGQRGVIGGKDALHSPFASALFEALAGAGDLIPKGQGDGVVTATELYLYLRQSVEVGAQTGANHAQTPELWPFSRQKHGKGEYIFLVPGKGEPTLPLAPLLSVENNPYRGLEPYNEQHADLFFGRTEQVKQLTIQVATHPLTVVLGASGTGKSSLVKAGLIPQLRHQDTKIQGNSETDASRYFILPPMRPGDAPLQTLADLLTTQLNKITSPVQAEILETVRDWLAIHPAQTLLLVVDQCEELITLTNSEIQRKAFLNTLTALLDRHGAQLRMVFTLRTDFEPQFVNTLLMTYWQVSRFVVTPLSQAELREVIELPAAQRVLFFAPLELVDRLIDEVIQTPGALPLLSFTLSELYLCYLQRQEKAQQADELVERTLTAADYQELGGVIGSLRTRADAVYDGLNPAHQATMQRVMLRMVAVEGGELARRRGPRAELEYPNEEENRRVAEVIKRLVDARLLVAGNADTDGDGATDEYVEPAHDALVRAWDKLLVWKSAAGEYLPLQRRLTLVANDWAQAEEKAKTGLLWNNNARLPQLQQVLIGKNGNTEHQTNLVIRIRQVLWPTLEVSSQPTWLNRKETDFVRQSLTRRATAWRQVIAITLGVVVALTSLTIFAESQRRTAVTREAEAKWEARRAQAGELAAHAQNAILTAKNDPSLALLLAIRAVETTWPVDGYLLPNADSALRDAIEVSPPYLMTLRGGHDQAYYAVYSPDGKVIATSGCDRRHEHFLLCIESSVRLWDALTGKKLQTLLKHTESISVIAYSPSGKELLTISCIDRDVDTVMRTGPCRKGLTEMWSVDTGEKIAQFPGPIDDTASVDFSPDGDVIVIAGCNQVEWIADLMQRYSWECRASSTRLWRVSTGKELLQLQDSEAPISTVSFSPDGQMIVTARANGLISIWDASSGMEIIRITGHDGTVNSAVFSADGKSIVSAGSDGTVRLWNVALGQELRQFTGHTNSAHAAILGNDGKMLLSIGDDSVVRIWNADTGDNLFEIIDHATEVKNIALSPDSKRLLTNDGTIRIWDLVAGLRAKRLTGHTESVDYASFSPDGKRILTASFDGTVRVWDNETNEEVNQYAAHAHVGIAAFSSDSKRILTASRSNVATYGHQSAKLLDGRTGEELAEFFDPDGRISYAALSPDQKQVATASEGIVRFWDIATGKQTHQLMGQVCQESEICGVNVIIYSPNGNTVVTTAYDQTVRLWDVATGQEILQFVGHTGIVNSAAFSLDGKTLVTAGSDKTVRVWDVVTGQQLRMFAGHVGSVQLAVYCLDDQYILSTSADKTIRVWNTATGATIRVITDFHPDDANFASSDFVACSPDGKTMLTASQHATVRKWLVDPDDLLLSAKRLVQREPPLLTSEEKVRYGIND